MNNFNYYAPTKVVFGKDTENEVGALAKSYGAHKVLIVYGGGSVVRSGLLQKVKDSLAEADIAYVEFGGAKPNPTVAHAREGIELAKSEKVDMMIAVGGGSTIDTAKAIAHGTANAEYDIWDIWTKKVPLTRSMPVGAILTIPAAGSEMSDSAVLTNEEIGKKAGINTDFNRCVFAIMNPASCLTLPKRHLAAGITDIMMHTMERYFIPEIKCDLTDEIAEGLLRTVVKNATILLGVNGDKHWPIDLSNPDSEEYQTAYNAMAEIMWAGSLSHNNLTELGRGKDFSVHKLGHALSARYDAIHGESLASVWKSWALYLYKDCPERFAKFAREVFGVIVDDDLMAAEAGIESAVDFWSSIGVPVTVSQLLDGTGCAIDDEAIKALSLDATMGDSVKLTRIKPLGAAEVADIYKAAI